MYQKLRLIIFSAVFIQACNNTSKEDKPTIDYPSHFPEAPPVPSRNVTSSPGILLGKRLFFDTRLSGNGLVSCSTCHKPELAFTDGKRTSTAGVSHLKLERNTPTLFNTAWMTGLFWDGGAKNLESLPFAALTNPNEMGADLKEIAQRLNRDEEYLSMFKNAFQIDSISSAYIARALAQYQRSLVSANSKFDRYVKGQDTLSSSELLGYKIFTAKCATCHTPPLFTDNLYHNNGLDSIFSPDDLQIRMGRFRITQDSLDIGRYKTPTLRNLSLTKPYMHDGRFETLIEVLNHYQHDIIYTPTTDSLLNSIQLTEKDKLYLLDYLSTLEDKFSSGQ